jgi:hypothetical protein
VIVVNGKQAAMGFGAIRFLRILQQSSRFETGSSLNSSYFPVYSSTPMLANRMPAPVRDFAAGMYICQEPHGRPSVV